MAEGVEFREEVSRDEYSFLDLVFVVFALEVLLVEVELRLVALELRDEFRLL